MKLCEGRIAVVTGAGHAWRQGCGEEILRFSRKNAGIDRDTWLDV